MADLKSAGIMAVFHYIPLHSSTYAESRFGIVNLPLTTNYSQRLLRLPMHFGLSDKHVEYVISQIIERLA
jgi:dTDP-4-amino-4,6-dideoxygalactose transaminase